MEFEWINIFGAVFEIHILIPNIVYAYASFDPDGNLIEVGTPT